MSREQKVELVRANRARLDQDLMTGRLVFESRPRVVEMQLSNFCNMSCTMCYDGHNPPMQKLPEDIVHRIAAEVLPTGSSLVPFVGSEPLIVTWDLTRELAQRYDVELNIITNVQFLDEKKFHELEPYVSTVCFSIDSHLRDVYERIRLRSRSDKVFANLPVAARLCREHGIEPQANVVFMVENAPYLDETVAFLADQGCTTVRVLEYVPHDPSPKHMLSDPRKHLSAEWMRQKRAQMFRVAKDKGIQLVCDGHERESQDFRPAEMSFREDRSIASSPTEQLRYYFPGYCPQAADHLKVTADGDAYPCCVVSGDDLRLGNLKEQSFDEVWNGLEAQDLRRAMLTRDLPAPCQDCHIGESWWAPEFSHMPFETWFHDVHCGGAMPQVTADRRVLEVTAPEHHARTESSPTFSWQPPAAPVDHYLLVVSVAGEYRAENRVFEIDGDATEYAIPDDAWMALQPNLGHWWTIYGVRSERLTESIRATGIRSLVRHQAIPRVAGSRLYANG